MDENIRSTQKKVLSKKTYKDIVKASRSQADQKVLRTLITNFLPDIDQIFDQHNIELSQISLNWFLTLFASGIHMKILRLWDLLLFDGSIVLFQVTLGILKIKETKLKASKNQVQILNVLSNISRDILDVDKFLEIL
ncbi:small G protein signaling modulator 3-like [Nasonia vitripennis]|uniref:Rab-GAP TBC domain-containing protein n=1 Tax=Nasonia vitripennis TaxID=7425 RepID=A0A7M7R1J7_NASVI|nr:small G protein signaling modulator 3-like [Nasonia vitripennis]